MTSVSVVRVFNVTGSALTISNASTAITGLNPTTLTFPHTSGPPFVGYYVTVQCTLLPTMRITAGSVEYALPDTAATCSIIGLNSDSSPSGSVPLTVISGVPQAGPLRYLPTYTQNLKTIFIYAAAPAAPPVRVCRFTSTMAPNAAVPAVVTVAVDGGSAVTATPFVPLTVSCPTSKLVVAINNTTSVQINTTPPLLSSKTVSEGPYFLSYINNDAGTEFTLKANAVAGGTSYAPPPSNSRVVDISSTTGLHIVQAQSEALTPNTIDTNPMPQYDVIAGVVKRVVAFPDTVFTVSLTTMPSVVTTITAPSVTAQRTLGMYDVVLRQFVPADSKSWILSVNPTPIVVPPALPPALPPASPPLLPLPSGQPEPEPQQTPPPSPPPLPSIANPSVEASPIAITDTPKSSNTVLIGIGIAVFVIALIACAAFFYHRHVLMKKNTAPI